MSTKIFLCRFHKTYAAAFRFYKSSMRWRLAPDIEIVEALLPADHDEFMRDPSLVADFRKQRSSRSCPDKDDADRRKDGAPQVVLHLIKRRSRSSGTNVYNVCLWSTLSEVSVLR